MLKLDDESFFDTHPPLPRAKVLPEIRDMVMAYGYPEGGTRLSITKGIVSRIEFESYNYPVSGLRIQIDAAINPGNSGGPAVAGDKMIGLAFSHLGSADNIGYIIPNEEIELFLQDIADGHYDGKPAMFDDLQTLENPALREFLKLDKSVQGMVVHKPDSSRPGVSVEGMGCHHQNRRHAGGRPGHDQAGRQPAGAIQLSGPENREERKSPADRGARREGNAGGTAGVAEASDGHAGPERRLPVLFRVRAAGVFHRHGPIHQRFDAGHPRSAGSTG